MILTLIHSESGSRFERTPGLKLDLCKLLSSDLRSYGVDGAWHCEVRETVGRVKGREAGGALSISPCINLPKAAIPQPQPPPLLNHFNCYRFPVSHTRAFQSRPVPSGFSLLLTFWLLSFSGSLQLIFLSSDTSSFLFLCWSTAICLYLLQFKQSYTDGESYPRLQQLQLSRWVAGHHKDGPLQGTFCSWGVPHSGTCHKHESRVSTYWDGESQQRRGGSELLAVALQLPSSTSWCTVCKIQHCGKSLHTGLKLHNVCHIREKCFLY